jgi:hypothetical protein
MGPVANTRILTTAVEEHVRTTLHRKHGVAFAKRRLRLTSGGLHEFDAVSDDGQFVASIKSASGRTSGGRIPAGKIKDCVAELYFLSMINAPRRVLILTTPDFYDIFTKVMVGKVVPGIEVTLCRLPEQLQAVVAAVQAAASAETSPSVDARY